MVTVFFPWADESKTRRQRFKMSEKRFQGDLRNFFTQRMVGIWSELPKKAVEVGTIIIKIHCDKYKSMKGFEGCVPTARKWDEVR